MCNAGDRKSFRARSANIKYVAVFRRPHRFRLVQREPAIGRDAPRARLACRSANSSRTGMNGWPRRRHCQISPGSSSRSKSSGGRPPPKCTYLYFSVRMTARLHCCGLQAEMRFGRALLRSSGNRTPNARRRARPRASCRSRNGASDRPSRWAGACAAEQFEQRRHDVDRFGEVPRPRCPRSASARGSRMISGMWIAAVEEAALAEHEMVAHHLGMVGGEHDDRVVPRAGWP